MYLAIHLFTWTFCAAIVACSPRAIQMVTGPVPSDTSYFTRLPTDTFITHGVCLYEANGFKVYYDAFQVIGFCDSLLAHTTDSALMTITNRIREEVTRRETKTRFADADMLLLARFAPLLVQEETGYKPASMLKQVNSRGGYGHTAYFAITDRGDTSLLALTADYVPGITLKEAPRRHKPHAR